MMVFNQRIIRDAIPTSGFISILIDGEEDDCLRRAPCILRSVIARDNVKTNYSLGGKRIVKFKPTKTGMVSLKIFRHEVGDDWIAEILYNARIKADNEVELKFGKDGFST